MIRPIDSSRRSQRGMALMVVLVLLVVLTLLALASVRGTLLEQFMSTSQMDRGLSFQSVEAALREGETIAAGKPTGATAPCANGLCTAPLPTAVPRWLQSNTAWTTMSRASTTTLSNQTAVPRFIIEVMAVDARPGTNCTTSGDVSPDAACSEWETLYRVTARSFAADRSEVILQSHIAVP